MEIYRALVALGVALPNPAVLIDIFNTFERFGIVNVRESYSILFPLAHQCEGCGQSCEGHLIGHVGTDEAQRYDAYLNEMRQGASPIPPDAATVEIAHQGSPLRVVSAPDGRCIFLDEQRQCHIHRAHGGRAKPLICRMFPFHVVHTESAVRLGVTPRCYFIHRHYRSGPRLMPEALMAAWGVSRPPAAIRGLDPAAPKSFAPTAVYDTNRTHEDLLLSLLMSAEPTLCGLLTSFARKVLDPRDQHLKTGNADAGPRATDPPQASEPSQERFGRAVHELLGRFLARQWCPTSPPNSRFHEGIRELCEGISLLDSLALPPWNDIPGPTWDYVTYCLAQFVFLREGMAFGSVRAGAVAISVGVIAARWLTARADLEDGPSDSFARLFVTWAPLIDSDDCSDTLFSDAQTVDALLSILLEP